MDSMIVWMTYLASDMGFLLFSEYLTVKPIPEIPTLLDLKQHNARWRCARDAGYGMNNMRGKGRSSLRSGGLVRSTLNLVWRQP